MTTYTTGSNKWRFRTLGGYSTAVGVNKGCFGIQIGAKSINFEAKVIQGHPKKKFDLNMTVSGIELSAELGKDLVQSLTGVSFAKTALESDYVIPCLNSKNLTEPKTYELLGPCALISYDVGKVHVIKDAPKKIASGTKLLIGMNTVIADQNVDWLQKVVDNAKGDTLGANFLKFNQNSGLFSNARLAIPVAVNDTTFGAKVQAAGVLFFSGQITAIGAR